MMCTYVREPTSWLLEEKGASFGARLVTGFHRQSGAVQLERAAAANRKNGNRK